MGAGIRKRKYATMTQEDLILTHLRSGRSITSLEALNIYGCFRLASRISDIRNKFPELNIKVDTIHNEQTGKHYASYRIVANNDLFT